MPIPMPNVKPSEVDARQCVHAAGVHDTHIVVDLRHGVGS